MRCATGGISVQIEFLREFTPIIFLGWMNRRVALEDALMEAPDDFHHPFQPYPIQRDFMRSLYAVIESKAVGIFESPTGTVLACPSLIDARALC